MRQLRLLPLIALLPILTALMLPLLNGWTVSRVLRLVSLTGSPSRLTRPIRSRRRSPMLGRLWSLATAALSRISRQLRRRGRIGASPTEPTKEPV